MAELTYVIRATTPAELLKELSDREVTAISKLGAESHRDRTKGQSLLRLAQIRWHTQQMEFFKQLVVLPPLEDDNDAA